MGFIMDGLDAEEYDRIYSDWALVKRILGYFKSHLWKMLVVGGVVFPQLGDGSDSAGGSLASAGPIAVQSRGTLIRSAHRSSWASPPAPAGWLT